MKKIIALIVIVLTVIIFRMLPSEDKLEIVGLSERASWLNTNQQVDVKIKEIVEKMIITAEQDGMCLVVSSGYRSIEEQEKIKKKYGDLAEEPGKSEHHTGRAVDLVACPMTEGKRDDKAERLELKKPLEELPEYEWLKNNADRFGLSQTYENEPWHWSIKI